MLYAGYMTKEELKEIEREIQEYKENDIYPIMPLLRKGVLHRTGLAGFKGIQESGYIFPNDKGQFPFSYSQSEVYFGQSKGYICLFDFESSKEEDYRINLDTWEQFFFDHQPVTIVLKLSREKLARKLIPNSAAHASIYDPNYKGYIPFVECWFPEPIPSSFIDSYILIRPNSKKDKHKAQEFPKAKIASLNKKLQPIEDAHKELEKLLGFEFIIVN